MESDKDITKEKKNYEAPEVIASYSKEELEKAIQPHGQSGGSGCGCGGGS